MSKRVEIRQRSDFASLYSRTPLSVTLDPALNHADRTAFDVIAFLAWPGNRCYESLAVLADILATGKAQVHRSVGRLLRCGHIRKADGALQITSPLFADVAENASAKETRGVTCGKCSKRVHSLLKVGWCRSCNFNLKIRKAVREEIATSRIA